MKKLHPSNQPVLNANYANLYAIHIAIIISKGPRWSAKYKMHASFIHRWFVNLSLSLLKL